MNEIEVKIIDINIDSLKAKLASLKAKIVKKEDQINLIYDFEDRRLLNSKGYARIRIIDDHISNRTINYMTTKKMLSQERFKEMEEHETLIGSSKEGEAIFNALGLKLISSIKKYRESYELNGSLVEIDINDKSFCPFPYIEIESKNEDDLMTTISILGFTMEDTTSKTIYEILKNKGVKGI